MLVGATEDDLGAVEEALGVGLPAECRALLSEHNGWERWYGQVFLMVYSTDGLVEVNRQIDNHPGFLAFASDGSRELIGFDLRCDPSPIVMIDITSAGWEEALFQAESLSEFMHQRSRGEDLRWDQPHHLRQ